MLVGTWFGSGRVGCVWGGGVGGWCATFRASFWAIICFAYMNCKHGESIRMTQPVTKDTSGIECTSVRRVVMLLFLTSCLLVFNVCINNPMTQPPHDVADTLRRFLTPDAWLLLCCLVRYCSMVRAGLLYTLMAKTLGGGESVGHFVCATQKKCTFGDLSGNSLEVTNNRCCATVVMLTKLHGYEDIVVRLYGETGFIGFVVKIYDV